MSTPPPDDDAPTRPGAPPRGLTPFVIVIGIAVLVVTIAMLARRDAPAPAPSPSLTTSVTTTSQAYRPAVVEPAPAATLLR